MTATAIVMGLLLAAAGAPAPAPPPVNPFAGSSAAMRALAERLAPSFVTVTCFERVPEGAAHEGRWKIADESPYPGFAALRSASGVVVEADGTILCCRSPLTLDSGSFAERIDVETATGARYEVDLLGSEPTINLAVLKLRIPETQGLGDLHPIALGSVDSLAAGEVLFAAADPPGSARTFAPGVVMAMPAAACYQSDLVGSLIQASMAVAPGAFGGALVNGAGEMVGLIVPPPALDPLERTAPHAFVTYGMQVQTAVGVAQALKQKHSHASPWLGCSVLARHEVAARAKSAGAAPFLAAALAKAPPEGICVDDVFAPSPAAQAGIQSGDWLVAINDRPVRTVVDFQQSLYLSAGASVTLRTVRDGAPRSVEVTIEQRPAEANRVK
jgi:S1-C subfamily serine protease